ncbi:hypothetical protein [Paracoccus sp. DMF]|uniref:hypothetical protein n=1 Tax=Paracoccus sp. DMF TaxID=400837 RepID=UPI0021E42BC5|nr:hypothetical protein [Paracoccus sp. DMF]MCV2449395.1 hypothetical protein [Paracoccus sp. DMF]
MSITAEMTRLLDERETFALGLSRWQANTAAAWKLAQMRAGIPACDWTDTPPTDFGPAYLQERIAA